ncbi:unnamed protein product [Soboliphyme baturini]|uniref:ATP-grasp_2 domain-containing protein n=1 Tax=Soboliphyme baturini TaxID=241478 RepID=A0A183J5Z8_9BILA|nr:unnamed protein product [Soboliphyme baturini]
MEYRSKELLQKHGLRVQNFIVVESVDEALHSLHKIKADEYVVKAQVLAGGREKGKFTSGLIGGVKLTRSSKDVISYVRDMIGYSLITKQTGPQGVLVKKVMIAESVNISKETYLAVLLDKESSSPVVMGCASGGVDIEEIAVRSPGSIFKEIINIDKGILPEQCLKIASSLRLGDEFLQEAAVQIQRLYDMFVKLDATMIEINPFCTSLDNKRE